MPSVRLGEPYIRTGDCSPQTHPITRHLQHSRAHAIAPPIRRERAPFTSPSHLATVADAHWCSPGACKRPAMWCLAPSRATVGATGLDSTRVGRHPPLREPLRIRSPGLGSHGTGQGSDKGWRVLANWNARTSWAGGSPCVDRCGLSKHVTSLFWVELGVRLVGCGHLLMLPCRNVSISRADGSSLQRPCRRTDS